MCPSARVATRPSPPIPPLNLSSPLNFMLYAFLAPFRPFPSTKGNLASTNMRHVRRNTIVSTGV